MIRFFTAEQFHNKKHIGSTNIRVHNLIKHWSESGIYTYGDKPDVLIFQKVYCTYDYKFPKNFKDGIKILDVCDIDWKDTPDIYIKETVDNIDAVVVPTKAMKDLISQMTTAPVVIIKDRFDIDLLPAPKIHAGKIETAVWFGYSHNAELLRFVVPSLENRNIKLIIVSNEDPHAYRWANDPETYYQNYEFIPYSSDQAQTYKDIQKGDVCILPAGSRFEDAFKSENKTILAQLLGIPVVCDSEQLDQAQDADNRNRLIVEVHDKLLSEYDCRKSVQEYKDLIRDLSIRKQA